jgi:hypothetical protein
MEGALLSLTVAGAVEASHLFPEHLAAAAIIPGVAGSDAKIMDYMQNPPLLLDAA